MRYNEEQGVRPGDENKSIHGKIYELEDRIKDIHLENLKTSMTIIKILALSVFLQLLVLGIRIYQYTYLLKE